MTFKHIHGQDSPDEVLDAIRRRRHAHIREHYAHLSPEDIKAISDMIDAKLLVVGQSESSDNRKHWKRRAGLSLVVLAGAAVTHHYIEHSGLRWLLQSLELGFAAMFDSLFTLAKDSTPRRKGKQDKSKGKGE